MNKEDITDEWVLANFDIDKERKTNTEVVSLGESYYDPSGKVELNKYLEDLKKSVEDQIKLFMDSTDFINPKILVEREMVFDWGSYDDREELMIYVSHDMVETDEQVVKRIRSRERGTITKAEAALKRKATKEAKERDELKRLREKYGEVK